MTRIYMDSNVYSNLRRNELPEYIQLNELLEKYKHNLSFFFSYAHIRDKRKDTSPIKFDDFSFMERFTVDNYVAHHPLTRNTDFYLATPRMVFDDEQFEQNDVSTLMDVFNPQEGDDPLVVQYKRMMKDQLYQTPFDLDATIYDAITDDQRELLEKILPRNKANTMGDFMENFMTYLVELNTDHETYRELRRMIDTNINNGKITLNGTTDYNEALRDTVIHKAFMEFVKSSVTPNANGNYPLYEFYLQAYNALDFLGISKDRISKKNNYKNLFSDGLHSYFGSYFNYLVTEDAGLTDKSKALYNSFRIKTKVLSIDDFITILPNTGKDTEDDLVHFFGRLNDHRKQDERSATKIAGDGFLSFIPIDQLYLNTFDSLLEQKLDDDANYYLFEESTGYLSGPNFRETGMIVSKALKLFGTDLYKKGEFEFEKELEEIRQGD